MAKHWDANTLRTRYETPAEQIARLQGDAAKFARGHARLIATGGTDFHRVKTSRNIFRAKIYNERLHPEEFSRVVRLFDDLVGKELDNLLTEIQTGGAEALAHPPHGSGSPDGVAFLASVGDRA